MFGLGLPEIIFILLIAVIILGPEHTPRAARTIGRISAKLRSAATTFESALTSDEDFQSIKSDFDEAKTEIDEAKHELTQAKHELDDVSIQTHQAFENAKKELLNFQASTGREPDSDEPDLPKTPEPSPFMSKPFCQHETSVSFTGNRSISLIKPRLLPGDISRQVSRKSIELSAPKAVDFKHQTRKLLLGKANTSCYLIRHLPQPMPYDVSRTRSVRINSAGALPRTSPKS